MTRRELYEKIEIPSEVVERLNQCEDVLHAAQLEPHLAAMMGETPAQAYEELSAILTDDPGCFQMLWCQLECARRCYEKYCALQIPDPIFVDTMKCFQRFLRECARRTGEMCFDRGWWTYRQISMRLFRVGQLEYELCASDAEPFISVHIPSDAVFTRQNVDESLRMSEQFIARYYPSYRRAKRVCSSWLLSPRLRQLLPESSNILAFQRRFEIQEFHEEDRDFMEWIFQSPKDAQYASLPEATSLQRAVKALLLQGGTIGAAYGIMK